MIRSWKTAFLSYVRERSGKSQGILSKTVCMNHVWSRSLFGKIFERSELKSPVIRSTGFVTSKYSNTLPYSSDDLVYFR